MAPRRPPPPVLKRSGFTLRGDTFGVEKHSRVERKRLSELFFPERLQEKAGVSDLKNLLKEAVAAGKVMRKCADNVVELERSMRAEYEPIFRAWDAEQKAIEDVAWSKRETPTERAEMDPERFISYYFLGDDGKPDPSKTKEPIALSVTEPYSPLGWELSREVTKIPGLHHRRGGSYLDYPATIYVGWDKDEVDGLAQKATEEADRQRKAELEGRWEATSEKHLQLIEKVKRDGLFVDPTSKVHVDPHKFVGSYVVRCKEIEKQWPPTENLTLDVILGSRNNILEAAMNLSMLEGTMLLALSESTLDAVAPSEEYPEYSEDDDDDEAGDGEQETGSISSRKRGAPATDTTSGPPSKKAKADVPEGRVFLRVTGRETGEGEVFSFPERGHLDFTDDTYTTFTGEVNLPHVGDKIPIEGRKVDAAPKRQPEPWITFSGGRYGLELGFR
ncbi:uncharacterized protein DNG_01492 [Cephalotrichum gorgonifer]|uniref:Uncharacterized protein n=1 Tax=Cephalotrichum gorgonifer TaxID=2041049 RepID=A0AAE8SSA1_9PEZI|nr:uncharacterized protein DNG_01492 [Cephalotrichum gorgonifer]